MPTQPTEKALLEQRHVAVAELELMLREFPLSRHVLTQLQLVLAIEHQLLAFIPTEELSP